MDDDFKCRDRSDDKIRIIKFCAIINDRIREEITMEITGDWFLNSKLFSLEDK